MNHLNYLFFWRKSLQASGGRCRVVYWVTCNAGLYSERCSVQSCTGWRAFRGWELVSIDLGNLHLLYKLIFALILQLRAKLSGSDVMKVDYGFVICQFKILVLLVTTFDIFRSTLTIESCAKCLQSEVEPFKLLHNFHFQFPLSDFIIKFK